MVVASTQSGTGSLTVPKQRFTGVVDFYHFTPVKTALADSTDVQLSDVIAPVNRPLWFSVRVDILTAYANGDGSAPVITIKGSLNGQVVATTVGDAAGTFKTFQGVLAPNEKLLFTPTAGTGTTETGTARVSATIIDPNGGL